MFAILFSLIVLNLTPAPAAAPVDPARVAAKLGQMGLELNAPKCHPESLSEGVGPQLSFAEIQFSCGDLNITLEMSAPVQSAVVQKQIQTEVARVHEVYGASKNPYAGYVSQTAQCPQKENLWQEKNGPQPLLIGRVTERGAWGACGKSASDNWAALTFVESPKALAKIRIQSQKPLDRGQFSAETKAFLKSLKAQRR